MRKILITLIFASFFVGNYEKSYAGLCYSTEIIENKHQSNKNYQPKKKVVVDNDDDIPEVEGNFEAFSERASKNSDNEPLESEIPTIESSHNITQIIPQLQNQYKKYGQAKFIQLIGNKTNDNQTKQIKVLYSIENNDFESSECLTKALPDEEFVCAGFSMELMSKKGSNFYKTKDNGSKIKFDFELMI